MARILSKGAEEARSQLPELLTAAQQGRQTVITRHGRPIAVLGPVSGSLDVGKQRSLVPLAGTARGAYGHDSKGALRRLRREWDR